MKAYKVIEESLSPSGKIEYKTLPMYKTISADEISGLHVFGQEDNGGIHSFQTEEDAEYWMKEFFVGYTYTRPVIFLVETIGETTSYLPKSIGCTEDCPYHMNISDGIKFIKPLKYMSNRKISEYTEMSKPEKKKFHGFTYNEDDITGDVDYKDEF